jgi:hypothetical protein
MIDWCVSCDKKKEGYIDDDPEYGTGWFRCVKCSTDMEMDVARELDEEYEYLNSLPDEEKAEIKSEMEIHHVDWDKLRF